MKRNKFWNPAKRNKFWNPAVMSGQCLKCEAGWSKNILIGVPPKVWMLKLLFFTVEIASAFISLSVFDAAAAAVALFAGAAVLLLDLLLEGESQYCRHCKSRMCSFEIVGEAPTTLRELNRQSS